MGDYVETILDLGSWILAGAFFGLTALGGLYYYEATRNPDTPRQSFEPVSETKRKEETAPQSFRPPEDFYLVQEYSRSTQDTQTETSETTSGTDEPETEPAGKPEKIVETELPYQLVGTVTGGKNFQQAVVRSMRERKTKRLTVGDSWKDLRVRKIADDHILIVNETNNRIEKVSLNPDAKDRTR